MATAPGWKVQGIGTGLIQWVLDDLQEYDLIRPIWCDDKVKSSAFYQGLGWQEVWEDFANGNAGLTVKILKGILQKEPKRDDSA